MCKITSVLFNMLFFAILIDISKGFYIKKEEVNKPHEITIDRNTLEQSFSMFNRGKQPTPAKVNNFRNEKPQTTALDKFLKMINHNKKANVQKTVEKQEANKDVRNLFNTLLTLAKEELKLSTLKTLNRPRRRISLQLVSDIPSDKIDELLKVFIDKNKINNADAGIQDQEQHDDDDDDNDNDDDYDDDSEDNSYNNFDMPTETKKERVHHDYAYDNLHECEQDMTAPRGSKSNSEYGSIQDLILQATKSQWQRDNEDSYNTNEHFI